MFEIDLLKGQAIPIKGNPKSVAVVLSCALPVILAAFMLSLYLNNNRAIAAKKQEMVNYDRHINSLSKTVEFQQKYEAKRTQYTNCLLEVASSTYRHTQWSPIIVEIVKNTPETMLLKRLHVKQELIRKREPKKSDPKQTIEVIIPVRTLNISIYGNPGYNCDKAVRDFRDRLRESELIGPKLQDMRVAQGLAKFNDQEVTSYEISLTLKPGS